jgi:hypothetical protein
MYKYRIFNSHQPQAAVFVTEQGNFTALYELFSSQQPKYWLKIVFVND